MKVPTVEGKLTVAQKVALEGCGGAVMLSLDNDGGCKFAQALNARDVGAVLGVCNRYSSEAVVCSGDLVVREAGDGVDLVWQQDGVRPKVSLGAADLFVFEEALKSYCRMLMRPKGDEP